jgi:hypothetical protein
MEFVVTDLSRIIANVSQEAKGKIKKGEYDPKYTWDYVGVPCKRLYNDKNFAYNDKNTMYDEDEYVDSPVYFDI